MPLRRYQIRNECSLADPELYRAADKNDPEALLEGFAMAGLVGVLRQLGDLSEFAAEVFHDLHEEVMATSARGHNLKLRVQQLEAEFPSIEKAFLSQTNHSSFFYNAGTDWHPFMPVDQHLISRGNMPRFIMDSYEECRGPPNLFLLDKFDIAGAGACLKRYTDPSFYRAKASNPGITSADVQCEKRTRRGKKKGSYWCKGEPQKVLPTSHFKLHRLLLEERIETTVSGPARSVNLKRRLNGFPFDSKTGESYMEKFTEISSEHKVVVERSVCSSPLKLPPKSTYESGLDRHAISLESPNEELRHRRVSPTTDLEGTMQNLSMDGDGISESPKANCGFEADNSLSTFRGEVCEKGIAIDEGSKMESNVRGSQCDDVASKVDNYADSLTTMESEMVTDSELRAKSDLQVLNNKRHMSGLYASEAQRQSHSSDSIRSSMSSDEGNSLFKKGISNSSFSDTPSVSADDTPLEDEVSCERFISTEISEAIGTFTSPNQLHANGDIGLAPSADDFHSNNLHVSGLPDNILRLDPAATSTDDQIESPVPVTSHVAEQSLDLMWAELETRSNGAGLDDGVRDVDVMISPSWVVAGDIEPKMESPNSCNLKELKAPVIICDIPKLNSVEDGTSCNVEENFHDLPSSPNEENIEVDNPGKDFVEMDATDLLRSPDFDSLTSDVHLTEADVKRDESDSAPLAGLEENGNQCTSLYLDLKKLDEESLLSFGESNKNRMEAEVSVPDSYSESGVVMEVGISQFASPDLSSDMNEPIHYDHTESEVLDNVPSSYSQVESSPDLDNTAETSSILGQSGLDTNRRLSQESNLSHRTEDASSLPIHCDTEEQKSALSLDQLDEVEIKVLQNEPEANIESSPHVGEIEKMHPSLSKFSKGTSIGTDSVYASGQPHEETSQHQHQIALETSLKDEKLDKDSAHSEENLIICDANALPTMIENEQVQNVIPSPEREMTSPAQEDAKVNEVRITKLPRPRNPMIDDVVGIEKIKLRKVTDRPRPPVQKVDERDSILEQIRAKSYNLKPTVVSRPIVQGPTTNLQVAALVEKAKAIQQTRAGSDEDDEDTWSD